MKRNLRPGLALLLALALLPAGAQTNPAGAPETAAQRAARLQWWRGARFGMFVHWGLYAVPAGRWHGAPVAGNGEWIMNTAQIPAAEYAALAGQFNPVKFDAAAWVRTARAAGMKYLVITAKHHDGFALFASQASAFNVAAATPFHRDPLHELAAACQAGELKLGFYYSQSQDWHHPGGSGNFWDPAAGGDFDHYLDTIAVPQVRELLSRYGPVAVLWYDTPRRMTPARAAKFLPLHALQPGLIINNRLRVPDPRDGATFGDTETPEQSIPPNGYPGRDWETCMTMNDTWGYKTADQNWKSAADLIRKLSDIASKGGNFLLNVGPTAQGEIPAPCVARLQTIGAWLRQNGSAIYNTEAGPFLRPLPWGRATRRENTLYLHVWTWPADGQVLLPGVHQLPANAPADDTPAGVRVRLPAGTHDPVVAIVPLEFSAPVTTSQTLPAPGPDGGLVLDPDTAEVTRGEIARGVISVTSQWQVQYAFRTDTNRQWRVTAEISPDAYNRLTVSAAGSFGRSVASAVQAWGRGPDEFNTVDLGVFPLLAGVNSLEIKSDMTDLRPLRIRRVWLTSLAP